MPTQAQKQPCVTWGKHKRSLAGESLAHQDWVTFIEDREWIPPKLNWWQSPELPAGTCWPGAGSVQNAAPADKEPLQRGHCLPHAVCTASSSHWSKGWVSCHRWWPQPCASMFCTWRRMGETTELLLTEQVWCTLHLHFHVECLAAGDGSFGVTVNGQPWWIPLLSVTSQFPIKLRFKCMSRFTCLKSSSHQGLLNSGFTVGWIAFNLRLM